ncbi:MAG TPA: alpha/beta hydrolase-fold protein [Bacteroidales bacterium]|nr:alpha/beta hydrolase-fold protein [Bacteroidales bacterium]
MKKLIVSIILAAESLSVFSQPPVKASLQISRDLVYFSQGDIKYYFDLYVPGGEGMPSGIGIDSRSKPHEASKPGQYPVIIWIPKAGAPRFPCPVASLTGNGYAVASVDHNTDMDVIKTVTRISGFLKGNAQKYQSDPRNVGVLMQVDRGYLAVIWEDGLKRLELLSDAPVRIGISAPGDKDYTMLQQPVNSKTLIGFFDRHLRDGNHSECDPLKISCPADSWIDPVTNAIPGTTYELFPTPSRGKKTQGSYLVYLPEGYAHSEKRYPVIYWLHGGNGNAREGWWMCARMADAMKKGRMPPTIIVFVQGLPAGWYCNSADSTKPVEDVIIRDLVPHIDAVYRTIDKREARGIEGMSMGGYGALHLGFKYPDLFGAVSAIAPSLTTFSGEKKEIIIPTFGTDSAYFIQNHPSSLLRANSGLIRNRTQIRLLVGDKDFLLDAVSGLERQLTDLKANHICLVAKGASHDYSQVIDKLETDPFIFWATAFGTGK